MSENQEKVDFKVDLTKTPEEIQEQHQAKKEEEAKSKKEVKEEVKDEAEQNVEVKEEVAEEEKKPEETQEKEVKAEERDLTDKEKIIKEYLSSTYNMDEAQLKDVLSNKEDKVELPEEVQKYLAYKNDTKRGMADFVAAQADYSKMSDIDLIGHYMAQVNPEYSTDDINYLMGQEFGYQKDDEENVKRGKILAMKKELRKAKEYFSNVKDKYHAPLESSAENVPENYKKALEFYKQYSDESTRAKAKEEKSRELFTKNTKSYFNDEFKGFEFKLGDKKLFYKPKDVEQTVNAQSDLSNFISKYLDADGNLVKAKEYHTALSMAMNPESYAKFFYEQGKADAVNDVVRDGKNVDMNVRTNVEASKPGPKFRVLQDSNDFSGGLKIRK